MEFANTPLTITLTGFVVASLLLYQVIQRAIIAYKRSVIARQRGCLAAPVYPQWDKVLGSKLFRINVAAIKAHCFLEVNTNHFRTLETNTFLMHAGLRRTHITIDPENLKAIQSVDFKNWGFPSARKLGFKPLMGDGIFTTDGAQWQHSRDLLRPSFVRSQVGDLPTFERHVQHLIAALPRDGSTVDLSELFFRLTIDSATEFLFGESTESLTRGSSEGFAQAFTCAQAHIIALARFGALAHWVLPNKQFKEDRKFVHEFVDHYVQLALAKRSNLLAEDMEKKAGRYVFMDELARQTTDPVQIRSELLNILLAGRDSTASLLTNVWFVLSQRPDIWNRLQAEIAVFSGQPPTFEQIKELKYLKALFNESLRLHPVVPMNSREAQADTVLPRGGGKDGTAPLFIKKGAVVAWNLYAMHRRKDLFGEDAEEFRPERWLDEGGRKGLRVSWGYLPFNGGPRICLGQQFALMEASYTTVRLCQAFCGIKSRDVDGIWRENLTLTCVNLNGAKVSLQPRE